MMTDPRGSGAQRHRELLEASPILGGLPAPALDALAKRVVVQTFAKGDILCHKGDPGDSLMLIVSGRVKISAVTANAREVILNFLGPGDVNGEIAVLDGRERTATATALEVTEVLAVQRRDLMPVLAAHPEAMTEVIAILCDKLRAASAMIEDSQREMRGRALSGLKRLAEQHGRTSKDGVVIDLTVSHRDLGSYLGLSRENTSRQLSLLKDAGIIAMREQQIVIVDADVLNQAADDSDA